MIVNNLIKKFPNFYLSCKSLEINSSGLYILEGKNGSGKTTFLKIISRLDKRYKGDLKIESFLWYFQDKIINNHLSFNQNIKLIKNADKIKINCLLNLFDCKHLINTKVCSLSIGEKQRLELITVLSQSASIYILDEPFSALDSLQAYNLSKYLTKLAESHLVILTDHTHRIHSKSKISIRNGKLSCKHTSVGQVKVVKTQKHIFNPAVYRCMIFNKANFILSFINLTLGFALLFLGLTFSSHLFNCFPKQENSYMYVYESSFSYHSSLDEFISNEDPLYAYYNNRIVIPYDDFKAEWKNKYPYLNFESLEDNIKTSIRYKLLSPFNYIEKQLIYTAIFSLIAAIAYEILLFRINNSKHKVFKDIIPYYYAYLISFYLIFIISCSACGFGVNVLLKNLLLK